MVRRPITRGRSISQPRLLQEWVGGRLAAPFEVESPRPHRPDIVFWMLLPEDLILHHTVVDSETPVDFAATLREAMARLEGSSPPPKRVRVANEAWAAEIRAAFGPALEVIVAPTPELDAVLAEMARSMPRPDDHRSYLCNGRIDTSTIAALFRAASDLWERAPWEEADDDEVLRVDIPRLGIRGACLSIIGALDQSYGFLLFPSRDAYERFADLEFSPDTEGPPDTIDFGFDHLCFEFVRKARLSRTMQRGIARHRWKVVSPRAHPTVERRSRHAEILPLREADLRIATACAAALSELIDRHESVFSDFEWDRSRASISETFEPEPGLEVTLRLEREDLVDLDEPLMLPPPPARAPNLGRNDPCYCGSGRKYKKCCLARDEEAHEAEARPHPIRALYEGASAPVELRNTDGDPLLLTTDHFAFEPGACAAVAEKLAAVEGAEAERNQPAETYHYTFIRPGNVMHAAWDNTIIGSATLSKRGLRVETNSVARAGALRARIEEACGSLLRHRIREHGDPQSPALVRDVAARRERASPPPPEALQILRAFKARHYADWADQPLPALAGRTPRDAIRTARGRKEVELLLKDMENHEARLAPGEEFDFGMIRRELELDA